MNREEFINELLKLNIKITDNQLEQLNKYAKLLISENKKYNLTAITEEEQIFLKHFYDSITLCKIIELQNQSLCDLGTGAGFPGLVLKILFPLLDITLIDATNKKCEFLKMVIKELDLKQIKVINARVEEYAQNNREIFDIVTARAVAPIKHLLEYGIPLVKVNGNFIAMKANLKEDELTNITNYYNKLNIKLIDSIEFILPKELSNRTLMKYKKMGITDKKYPRKYSEIKKRDI